ncbi:uncharacterized protein LOC143548337 [Bidens hawaiensis]|uniref:uncharacterized protein LOC143548337 n=1 Tax=Bidens hawaiensis TaxID=980011 RepID=UPI004049A2C6
MTTELDPESHHHSPSPSDLLFVERRRCFCIPYRWQKVHNPSPSLWSRSIDAFKKLREWSELIAGPRWKTFIRRFNRNKSSGRHSAKFQYDPLDYPLNFDQGPLETGDSEAENEYMVRNFSSRYVARTNVPVGSSSVVSTTCPELSPGI